MDANRRQYLRQPIALSALVHPASGRSWLCTIRDFCQGGMLLTGAQNKVLAAVEGFVPGAPIDVHFSVATPRGAVHFRLPAVIARLLDNATGLGIVYRGGLPIDAFDALMEYAVASGTVTRGALDGTQPTAESQSAQPDALLRDQRVSNEDAARVRAQLKSVMKRALERISGNFFSRAKDQLLAKSADAGTNAIEMMYYEGLQQLTKQESAIDAAFRAEVLAQIDSVADFHAVLEKRRRRETGSSPNKLALVDQDQFEDWLVVAETISKTENRLREPLLDLAALLELLAKPWGHKDILPIGPAVVTWAFADATDSLDLRRQVREDLFAVFQQVMLPILDSLYRGVRTSLDDSGILPSVEEIRRAQVKLRPAPPPKSAADAETYHDMDSAVREAAMSVEGVGTPRTVAGHDPFSAPRGGVAQVYGAARELLSLGRRTREQLGRPPAEDLAPSNAPSEARFSGADILGAFRDLQSELGDASLDDQELRPRLMAALRARHGGAKKLGEDEHDALSVVEGLVDSMREDLLLTTGVRDWIKRLEITLNKLAAIDRSFLQHHAERPHSAAEMLNLLGRLGNASDAHEGIEREVGQQVDATLERVVRDFDDNPQVFDEAIEVLNPLLDKQTRAYRGNVERTVRASEGQQKLARARRAVLMSFEARFTDRDVPELLLEFINPAWRNLLVHTHLRHGDESPEWRDALMLVDQLWEHLNDEVDPESPDFVPAEALLKRVIAGLNDISYDPARRTPLVMKLSDAVVGNAAGERTVGDSRRVTRRDVQEAVGLAGLLPESEPDIDSEDEAVRQSWSQALERARRVQIGEWVATADAKGRPLILTVAFVGDQTSSFVLVNRKGVKSRELTLKQMTDGLFAGEITLLEDYDLPLMERASQRMLQNMHNELAHQATHDELTQLRNRKELERALERAIARAKAGRGESALFHLDLDQFKIINNTSGHAAGDKLLQTIARRLSALFDDGAAAERPVGTVARLSGDEFGILLDGADAKRAREFGNALLQLIRSEPFQWEERTHVLSASVGLSFVDAATDVQACLLHAEEACFTAKESGRNRLQEYELGDQRLMQRQGVMEWVTQLDKALADDRLVLNCQQICPIVESRHARPHYEILLTLRDEHGDTMAPTDFILAAETYNRMVEVDRWVISNVFAWMAEHRSELDGISGFAINVSGHSVNDEAFADFVLDQFAATQTPTAKVCFEITETAAISNLDNAIDFMNRMKIIGCRFSLDDFGTGLSSYSYLRNLPVDYVKIDGVFVKDLADSPGDFAVVRSINEIGHYMGKKTIAEYVEDEKTLAMLREIGVDYAQGFGIGRPVELANLQLA
ncbi:MAG: DUF1631 family protein [Pseudomonadota bacterium]